MRKVVATFECYVYDPCPGEDFFWMCGTEITDRNNLGDEFEGQMLRSAIRDYDLPRITEGAVFYWYIIEEKVPFLKFFKKTVCSDIIKFRNVKPLTLKEKAECYKKADEISKVLKWR